MSLKTDIDFIKSIKLNSRDINYIKTKYPDLAQCDISAGILAERKRIYKILKGFYNYNLLVNDQKSKIILSLLQDFSYSIDDGFDLSCSLFELLKECLEGFKCTFSEEMCDSAFMVSVDLEELYFENKEYHQWVFQEKEDSSIILQLLCSRKDRIATLKINKLGQYISLTKEENNYLIENIDKDINIDTIYKVFEWAHETIKS